MNYEEARVYLDNVAKYGSVLGLDAMRELLKRLGNPEKGLKIIHIAGTNGKGSVLAFLSTVLTESGYRVGRYISPTLFSYRERIQVNGAYIEKEPLARLVTKIREASESMDRDGLRTPTAFEIETALGLLYFAEKKCDAVVLETGMGGRDDATNAIEEVLMEVFACGVQGGYHQEKHAGRFRFPEGRGGRGAETHGGRAECEAYHGRSGKNFRCAVRR